jgi:hypothetical protein
MSCLVVACEQELPSGENIGPGVGNPSRLPHIRIVTSVVREIAAWRRGISSGLPHILSGCELSW